MEFPFYYTKKQFPVARRQNNGSSIIIKNKRISCHPEMRGKDQGFLGAVRIETKFYIFFMKYVLKIRILFILPLWWCCHL